MTVMSPRIAIGQVAADGSPPLPASMVGVTVWTRVATLSIGGCPSWEFRSGDSTVTDSTATLATIQRVALTGDGRAVWIAWVPAASALGDNADFDLLAPALVAAGVLDAWWLADAGGTISAVEADATPNGAAALAAWPATWRRWLQTDTTAPTGARCIACGLA